MTHLLFLLFIGSTTLFAQTPPSDTTVYEFLDIDQQPEYPGGAGEMIKFITKNIQYPEAALKKKIEGTVVVKIIIEKDGTVSNPEIFRNPGGGLGEEAVRVILMMPKWKPALSNGEPVRTRMMIPVRFRTK